MVIWYNSYNFFFNCCNVYFLFKLMFNWVYSFHRSSEFCKHTINALFLKNGHFSPKTVICNINSNYNISLSSRRIIKCFGWPSHSSSHPIVFIAYETYASGKTENCLCWAISDSVGWGVRKELSILVLIIPGASVWMVTPEVTRSILVVVWVNSKWVFLCGQGFR